MLGGQNVKRAVPIVLVLVAAGLAAVAASARVPDATPTPTHCGGVLWKLKTLSDPGRTSVALAPKATTIGAIVGKPYPRPVPRKRRTAFQRQNWEVVAQVTAFRLEDAGLRLILFDDGAYVNAVIPVPSCLSRVTRARTSINDAWNKFVTSCTRPSRDWQPLGAIVYVRGVGLWSERQAERGAAPNGAELYPVTGFRIVAGCH
jgi:hypothetical protein